MAGAATLKPGHASRQCDAVLSGSMVEAQRADLNTPLLYSNTNAEREAELTQLNGKLYTVEKAQFANSCPLVANAPPPPLSAVVQ